MLRLFYSLFQFLHLDPRVYELEKELEFHRYIIFAAILVIIILGLVVYLQRKILDSYRKGESPSLLKRLKPKPKAKESAPVPAPAQPAVGSAKGKVTPKELPDPGLIFKYSLAREDQNEKTITIGQTEGNIKTYSTEIIDNHLSINIRIIENKRDQDIYNLPDKLVEEYLLDIRRDGKALIYYPGLENFREMGSRERIYIKKEPDETGDPTFPSLEAKQPVRFRLGDRLNQDGKFVGGYFEFHLFTQDYEVKTKAGIPKIEKNFLVRLYKIYPGYDTGAPNDEGLYPMIDPFTAR
jgi:hypothetical protein